MVNNYIDTVSIKTFLEEALQHAQGHRYQRIAKGLEQMIQQQALAANQKLPTHRALADALAVTPGTIASAYKELEKLGLVTSRVGDGTYVRDLSSSSNIPYDFSNATETADDVIDLSRNTHIPDQEATYFATALQNIYTKPQLLAQLTQYTPDHGLDRHREAGAQWFKTSQIDANREQVICTNGAQHGLLCALLSTLKRGDMIATERVSYPGLISLSRKLGVKLVGLALDDQGLIPEALDEACKTHHISVLYCTPTFQNPTTATMSEERRQAIAQLAKQHNLIIVEDDAHGVLASHRFNALQTYAPERTILLSSLTKAVSAGLRVGYILSPPALVETLASTLRTTSWMATPISHEIATQLIQDQDMHALIQRQIAEINLRKQLAATELEGLHYQTQENCGHFWIEVPEPWRCTEIENELSKKGILVKSAESFAVGRKETPQYIRACVGSAANHAAIIQGFKSIRYALQE